MFKNWKIVLLISLLMLYMACEMKDCWFVHNPAGPDDPVKADDVVEFRYVRDLAIINPSATDPTRMMLYSDEFGGINMPNWNLVRPDVWETETPLQYSNRLYHPWVGDGKVSNSEAVADTVYARIKGTLNWTKLPTTQNGFGPGKWANFYLNQQGIQTPSN